jgi:hypothetical protein
LVTLTYQYEDKPHRKIYKKAIRRIDYSVYSHDWSMRKRVGARVDQVITEKRANGEEIDLMSIAGQICEEIIPFVQRRNKYKEDWWDEDDEIMIELELKRILCHEKRIL